MSANSGAQFFFAFVSIKYHRSFFITKIFDVFQRPMTTAKTYRTTNIEKYDVFIHLLLLSRIIFVYMLFLFRIRLQFSCVVNIFERSEA